MWASDVRRSHAVNGVHDVQPPSKSHIRHCHNFMQMACGSAEREKREGEEREGQLTHSLQHLGGTHHPSSLLLPSLPPDHSLPPTPTTHILTPLPPLIWLTITSTSLLLSTCLSFHTHTSQTSPNACASAQRKRSSSSSSSPTARVPHHHQQLKSSSTCMPHMHTQATSGTCVSE